LSNVEFEADYWNPPEDSPMTSGTSIFDPVLTELAYRWFCPQGGSILDPFAGGSVRGIVAAHLGYQYTGLDLRSEQIAAISLVSCLMPRHARAILLRFRLDHRNRR